jgi:hypothetical protein
MVGSGGRGGPRRGKRPHAASVFPRRAADDRAPRQGWQRPPKRSDRVTPVARRTIQCPQCGLALTIGDVQGVTQIAYDPAEWRRRCKHLDLDSPALCLLAVGGSGGDGSGRGSGPPKH